MLPLLRRQTSQPAHQSGPSELALSLGITRLFNAATEQGGRIFDEVTGESIAAVSASSVTRETTPGGIAVRSNGAAYWEINQRNDANAKGMFAVWDGRLNTATNQIILRDTTNAAGSILIWRAVGWDVRVGGTDYTAAGTWNLSQDYCVVFTSSNNGVEIWVNGARVLTGSAAASGSTTGPYWVFGNNGTNAGQTADQSWRHFALGGAPLNSSMAAEISANPLLLYAPQRIWVPFGEAGTSWSASLSEAATAGDSVVASLIGAAALTESSTANDALTAAAVLAKALTEAATAADSITATTALLASLQEAATAGDSQAATLIAVAVLAAAVTAAETIATGTQYAGALTEAATAADSSAAVAIWVRALAEAATAADGQAAAAVLLAVLAESASAADAVASATPATHSASVSELADALDALVALFSIGPTIDFDNIRRVVRGGLITRLVQEAIARGTKGQ